MTDMLTPVPLTIGTFREAQPGGPDGIEGMFVEALFMRVRRRPMNQVPPGVFIEAAIDMVDAYRGDVAAYWHSQRRGLSGKASDWLALARKFAATLPRTKAVQTTTLERLEQNRSRILTDPAMTQGCVELWNYDKSERIEQTISRSMDYVEFLRDTALHDRLFPLYRELTCDWWILQAVFGSDG